MFELDQVGSVAIEMSLKDEDGDVERPFGESDGEALSVVFDECRIAVACNSGTVKVLRFDR